jgi:tRNA(fMet)-specific endonuclease VapC
MTVFVGELHLTDLIKLLSDEKARLRRKGTIISDLDLFIGATAVFYDMTLVTRNIREFERMENLKLENWIDR